MTHPETVGFAAIPADSSASPPIPANSSPAPAQCRTPGCSNDAARSVYGFCRRCYLVNRAEGVYEHTRPAGEASSTWKGDRVGLVAAHDRIRSERGSAHLYSCGRDGCTAQAAEWALIPGSATHCDVAARRHYSVSPEDYVPRCQSCHRRMDLGTVGLDGHPVLDFAGWDTEAHRIRHDAPPPHRHERYEPLPDAPGARAKAPNRRERSADASLPVCVDSEPVQSHTGRMGRHD